MEKKMILVLLVFALSRFYIFNNPPPDYSDVRADYERYANIWRYGLTPYLEHLYEYPPATIPLLSLPLELDQRGIGKYYPNYRTQILIIDISFFGFLFVATSKLKWLKKRRWEALLWYVLLTTYIKNFFYEGIDLAFTASIMTAFFVNLWFKANSWTRQILTWTFFWLSVAIKFLTFPLLIPIALLTHTDLKKSIFSFAIGFLLIWGIPLALYRSSLQVMFVYNNNRPIKYASFSSYLIQLTNGFTQTEEQAKIAPDYPYVGPVSEKVTKINKVVFPISIFLTILWSVYEILKAKYPKKKINLKLIIKEITKPKVLNDQNRIYYLLKIYGVYIFVLFLSAKIFSQPFHIWYLPLISLFPFVSRKYWYKAIFLGALMLTLDTTEFFHLNSDEANPILFAHVRLGLIRDAFRFLPMFAIIWLLLKKSNLQVQDQK